jgi:two-component system response regulator HydG
MTPRLIAISGKMKGTVFALGKKEANIGREITNAICLNDPSVSRQHCLIKQNDEGLFFIHDLESFNGVFVNGTPVNDQEIKHGDQLGIGDVIMFFLLREQKREQFFIRMI